MSTKNDVNHIFKTINAITNKEQKGYLKTSEFNTLLQQAELEIFEDNYFNSLAPNKIQRGVESDSQRTDALSPYLRQVSGIGSSVALDVACMHVVGVYSGSYAVKFIRHSELGQTLNSSIVSPTKTQPIYTIAPTLDFIDGVPDTPETKLNFYTSAVGEDEITYRVVYLARPSVPAVGHYSTGVVGYFDTTTSTALMAPKSEHPKIMNKMLQFMGIHMNDGEVLSYATNELTSK
jgi:hypothetical protein